MLRKLVSLSYINLAGNTSGSVYTNLQLALITFSTMYHFWSRYTLKVLSPSDKQFAFNFSFETRKELCDPFCESDFNQDTQWSRLLDSLIQSELVVFVNWPWLSFIYMHNLFFWLLLKRHAFLMLFQDQLILSRLQISYRCHCVVVLRIVLQHSMISCPPAVYFILFLAYWNRNSWNYSRRAVSHSGLIYTNGFGGLVAGLDIHLADFCSECWKFRSDDVKNKAKFLGESSSIVAEILTWWSFMCGQNWLSTCLCRHILATDHSHKHLFW